MVEMIRGREPLDALWFAGGPSLSPLEQISVYKRQYRLRLGGALGDEVPGLRWLLGEDADSVLDGFLMAKPSTSYTLNRVADGMVEWLAERDSAPEILEMARLDHAVQSGFEADWGRPLDVARLAAMPRLELQPHVTLLRNRTNVHELRSAVMRGADPPALIDGDYPIVIFRRNLKMRHWVMDLGAWGVLREIEDGRGVDEAIEAVFSRGWVAADDIAGSIQQWFQDYAERNLVQVVA